MSDSADEKLCFFQYIDGMPFLASSRPPFWVNPEPLKKFPEAEIGPPELSKLPLQDFPVIDDFQIVLEHLVGSEMGYHVKFFSMKLGYIAGFAWWDNAEKTIVRSDFLIPIGPAEDPFYDLEQGWEISIFELDGFVYVIEGSFDQGDEYHAWFKVPISRYLSEWRNAVSMCIAARQN